MKEINNFIGKTVSFGTANDTLAIKNCQFETIRGKLLVTGVIPNCGTTNNWAVGRECSVAWDSVTDFIVFDTEEIYAEMIKKSESDKKGNGEVD